MIHWIYNTLHEGGYSLKLILEYLKRYKLWFVLNVISVFGFALVELGIPTIIAYMIDQGVMNEDRGFLMKMGSADGRHLACWCLRNDSSWLLLRQDFHRSRT